jgi:hypothetical protein
MLYVTLPSIFTHHHGGIRAQSGQGVLNLFEQVFVMV